MSTQRVYVPALLAQPGLPRSAHSARDFLWSNLIVRAIEGPARSRHAVTESDDPFNRIIPLVGMNIPKAGQ
jgi:hypothetical protein